MPEPTGYDGYGPPPGYELATLDGGKNYYWRRTFETDAIKAADALADAVEAERNASDATGAAYTWQHTKEALAAYRAAREVKAAVGVKEETRVWNGDGDIIGFTREDVMAWSVPDGYELARVPDMTLRGKPLYCWQPSLPKAREVKP